MTAYRGAALADQERHCRRCGEDHWTGNKRPFLHAKDACTRYGRHAYELPNPTPAEISRIGMDVKLWMWGPTIHDGPDGPVMTFGYDSGD